MLSDKVISHLIWLASEAESRAFFFEKFSRKIRLFVSDVQVFGNGQNIKGTGSRWHPYIPLDQIVRGNLAWHTDCTFRVVLVLN